MQFVDFTLSSTENVRRILQADCDGANFVLRPWIVETLVTRQVDGDCCTCAPIPDAESQAQEIATGIKTALAQAQKFRESISLKNAEAKRKNSKPTLQNIYAPHQPKSKAKTTVKEQENRNHAKVNMIDKSEKSKPKNFIAANKMSVRMMSQNNSKSTNDLRNAGNSKTSLRAKCRYPSVTELHNLIKKISLESSNSASSPSLVPLANNCPVHGDNSSGLFTERKRVTIDLVEALNRFGVPEELLKPLKIYHSYVNKQNDEKKRDGVKTFLDDLNSFHHNQSQTSGSNNHVRLIKGFGELYRDLHETPENSALHKKKYFELDNLSKISKVKKYDVLKTRRSTANGFKYGYSVAKGWLQNGIWNQTSYKYFLMFTEPLTIQYSDKNELLSLFVMIQRLQQTLYQKDLNDLIINSVIPFMKTLDPSSEEYLYLYKMIFSIAHVLNPQLPVLVKTED
ncbi:uncharacterized protein LOC135162310 [Diachasmimorpha longicaudata]|uniref:uncharacterized protein LOC135162310 n=1 Tax=Diachasmimorpha longicaudata TaxID=58733 RepID=UPI0030B8CD25